MSKKSSLITLTPPVELTRTFDVRSPADAREPVKTLRDWSSQEPVLVIITREPKDSQSFARLIEAMLPSGEVPTPVEALQARRNAQARWGLLSEFGAFNAAQVSAAAGSRAKNTSALAGRWLRDGVIFSVTHAGTRYFPAFQFDEFGRPRPVIAEILPWLERLGEWQRALWFVTRSRRLGDERPVDLLDEQPDAVIAAARASAEPVD